jgi:hypothetical protein
MARVTLLRNRHTGLTVVTKSEPYSDMGELWVNTEPVNYNPETKTLTHRAYRDQGCHTVEELELVGHVEVIADRYP